MASPCIYSLCTIQMNWAQVHLLHLIGPSFPSSRPSALALLANKGVYLFNKCLLCHHKLWKQWQSPSTSNQVYAVWQESTVLPFPLFRWQRLAPKVRKQQQQMSIDLLDRTSTADAPEILCCQDEIRTGITFIFDFLHPQSLPIWL